MSVYRKYLMARGFGYSQAMHMRHGDVIELIKLDQVLDGAA